MEFKRSEFDLRQFLVADLNARVIRIRVQSGLYGQTGFCGRRSNQAHDGLMADLVQGNLIADEKDSDSGRNGGKSRAWTRDFPATPSPMALKSGLMFDKLQVRVSRGWSMRAEAAPSAHEARCALRGASDFYNRQVLLAAKEADFKGQLRAGAATHQRPRLGARRAARPTGAWLETRFAVGGEAAKVHLVRRAAAKPRMWPRIIVPFQHGGDFAEKRCASIGNEQEAREQAFDRQDGSFHDGKAAVFSNRPVAWRLDALSLAPSPEARAIELFSAIADDIARDVLGFTDRSA